MATVQIQITGAQEAARELRELDRRQTDLRPLLEVIGQQVADWAKNRIEESGADLRGTADAWPAHHPATTKIRRHYGHEGKPMLFRGGETRDTIRPRDIGPNFVDVVSDRPWSATVQEGGTTSRGGQTRTVPARPFLLVTEQQVDDLAEMTLVYLTEPDTSPEAGRA